MLLARRHRSLDRTLEFRVLELAGDAERDRKVEMADPKAVDPVDGGHRVGILDAFRRLDLAEQGRTLVGGRELVGDRPGR